MPSMPTMPSTTIPTVIDIPTQPSGPIYITVYTDLCTFMWHPGVYLKIDNPKNSITDINSFGEGCVLTTNRVLRTSTPSGGSSGWLTDGTSGSINNSVFQTYKTKKSKEPESAWVTNSTPILEAKGTIGNRQPNYPAEENSNIVINKYLATSCTTPTNNQINKYKKSYAYNQPIKGNYFNQSTWVKFCHDYNMTTFSDVNVSYFRSQTEALTIKRVKNKKPVSNQRVLTIKTIPETANVLFTTPGSVFGKSIMVVKNTIVDFTVSAEHYETETHSVLVIDSKTETIELNPEIPYYTFTIFPGPETAAVSFNDTPGTVIGNSIAVEAGTTVHYTVSAPNYITQDDYYTVTSNDYKYVILVAEPVQPSLYKLTVNPSPSDSTVIFNTQGEVSGNSITVPEGTIVNYVVSHDGYITQNLSTTVNSNLEIEIILQTSILPTSTLTIVATPSDASISFSTGQVLDNSTVVPTGTTVTYTISKIGYITQSAMIDVVNDLTLNISLQEQLYVLTVNPTPNTAVVTFETAGIVSGNTITVPYGTQVFYTASATGYITASDSTIVDQTKTVEISLNPANFYTITINPEPADATVTFTSTGIVSGNTITVAENTVVNYEVSAAGYTTVVDSTIADRTKTIDVQLSQNFVQIAINPTPSDSTVTFNTAGVVSGNTITVPQNTTVSYTVTKEDYEDYTNIVVAYINQTIDVILNYKPYEEGEVVYESDVPGTYLVDILISAKYQLTCVAGGGGAANGFKYGPQQQGYFNGSAGGGSGGYSSGVFDLQAGQISAIIGDVGNTVIASAEGEVVGTDGTNSSIGDLITAYGGKHGYVDMTIDPKTAVGGLGGDGTTTSGLKGHEYKNTLRTTMYRQAPIAGADSVYLNYGKGSGITSNADHINLPNPGTSGYVKIVYLGSSILENVTITIIPTPSYASILFNTEGYVQGSSITVPNGTVVSYTVSATGYYDKTQNITATTNRSIEVDLDARPPQYTLTIFPGPETATVTFQTEGILSHNAITVEANTEVFYTVEAPGYITRTASLILNSNQDLQVVLEAEHIITPDPVLTVRPTPSTATVTFNTAGTVSGNNIAVPAGTTVEYEVSATGYETITDTYTVTENTTIDVVLQPVYIILTIKTSPQNATVTFETAGTVSGNSITVTRGATVRYTVSALGYETKTETYTVQTTQEILVTLTAINVHLTVNPEPADATVTFTSAGTVSGNTITVVQYSSVSYTITRTGYETLSRTVTVASIQNISEPLTPLQYNLTVDPTYSAATVTFNTAGTVIDKTITVPYNTVVNYTVSATNHESVTSSITVTENTTVQPRLRLSLINPTIASTTAVANSVSDGGQAITGGNYSYSRGNSTYTFTVNVNERGVVQSITNISHTGGDIKTTNPHQLNPTGGWIWLEIWD